MRKHIKLLIVLLAALFVLVACSPQDPLPEDSPTPSPSPVQEDENGAGEEGADDNGEVEDEGDEEGQTAEANTPEGVQDGEYTGRSETDERGGYGVVTLTVENEEITEANFEEFTSDDQVKSEENDYEYEEALRAFEELPNELIETQDVSEVDDYSGATSTTKKFRSAAQRALGQGVTTENDDEDNEN